MGVLAVGTGRAETELVADLEVGTGLVDLAVVDDGELVAALFLHSEDGTLLIHTRRCRRGRGSERITASFHFRER